MFSVMKIKIFLTIVISGVLLQAHAGNVDRIFVKGGTLIYKDGKVMVESFEISKYEITNERHS